MRGAIAGALLILSVGFGGQLAPEKSHLDASHITVVGERYQDGHDVLDPFSGPTGSKEFHYTLPDGVTRGDRIRQCYSDPDERRAFIMYCFWEYIDWVRWVPPGAP